MRARNNGSLKSTQVAQDDIINHGLLNVFENDGGGTGLAVLPKPAVNETKVMVVVLGFSFRT